MCFYLDIQTCLQTQIQTPTHIHEQVCACTWPHACMHARMHARTHTRTHTHTHTHKQTQTQYTQTISLTIDSIDGKGCKSFGLGSLGSRISGLSILT